jgi:putative transposase
LIDVEKGSFPVALMCDALGVSRSGYYAWCGRGPSERAVENAELEGEILDIFEASRRTYGSPRVHAELRVRGFAINRKRVERQMREMGLAGRRKPRFQRTTDSNHAQPIAPNILERNFEVHEPDTAWVADVTYIWTAEGWVYLAVILDLFSRRIIGWSMADHMRVELVLTALEAALGQRIPNDGMVFHSDRGSQYAANEYRAALNAAGITCSMSRRGNCWDNAVAESFFATLKTEFVHEQTFTSRDSAMTAIAEWIEVFYNRQRRHSTLGYCTPAEFERQYYEGVDRPQAA